MTEHDQTAIPERGKFPSVREVLLELRITQLEAELRLMRSRTRFALRSPSRSGEEEGLVVPDVTPRLRVASLAEARVSSGGGLHLEVTSRDADGRGFKHGVMVTAEELAVADHVELMAHLYRRCFDDLVKLLRQGKR